MRRHARTGPLLVLSTLTGALALGGVAAPLAAQPDRQSDRADHTRPIPLEEARPMVERIVAAADALDALDALGRDDLRDQLRRLARELDARIEQAQLERDRIAAANEGREPVTREVAEARLELISRAVQLLSRSGDNDPAARLKNAAHAYKVALEGREDEEAQRIRKSAPRSPEVFELLGHAAHVAREHGQGDQAERLIGQRDRLFEPRMDRDAPREPRPEREPPAPELESQRHHLEMLEIAAAALREGGRRDAVELAERAMQATRMNLQGREDPESREIRERAPEPGAQAELLSLASRLWIEFGHETKATLLREHAEMLRQMLREGQARTERESDAGRGDNERVRRLQRSVEELRAELERARHELEAMRRRGND